MFVKHFVSAAIVLWAMFFEDLADHKFDKICLLYLLFLTLQTYDILDFDKSSWCCLSVKKNFINLNICYLFVSLRSHVTQRTTWSVQLFINLLYTFSSMIAEF